MRWALRIGSIYGIAIRIHFTFHSGTHFGRVTVGKIVGTSRTIQYILSQLGTTSHKSQTRCVQGGCRLSVVRPTT